MNTASVLPPPSDSLIRAVVEPFLSKFSVHEWGSIQHMRMCNHVDTHLGDSVKNLENWRIK